VSAALRSLGGLLLLLASVLPVADWLGVTLPAALAYDVRDWWTATAVIGASAALLTALTWRWSPPSSQRIAQWWAQHALRGPVVVAALAAALVLLDAWWIVGDVAGGALGALAVAACVLPFAAALRLGAVPPGTAVVAALLLALHPALLLRAASAPLSVLPLVLACVGLALGMATERRARGLGLLLLLGAALLAALPTDGAFNALAAVDLRIGLATLSAGLHQVSTQLFATPVPVTLPLALVLWLGGPLSRLELLAAAAALAGMAATVVSATGAPLGHMAVVPSPVAIPAALVLCAPAAILLVLRFPALAPAGPARRFVFCAIAVTALLGLWRVLPAQIAALTAVQ
jgi:hypothetical protein